MREFTFIEDTDAEQPRISVAEMNGKRFENGISLYVVATVVGAMQTEKLWDCGEEIKLYESNLPLKANCTTLTSFSCVTLRFLRET